jgi:GTP-binding protein
MHTPLIAIVGKSNVGKSTLFNRLIGRRRAIVSPDPGVTRDINCHPWTDMGCVIADSAGYTNGRDGLSEATRAHNRRLIDEADLVLVVCDVFGLDAGDFEIADLVRRSGKPFLLVLNKADNRARADLHYDYYRLGLGEPVPVSALHGRNIDSLAAGVEATLSETPPGPDNGISREVSPPEGIGVAIMGKPNVGKSSLINMLLERNRMLVTPMPGTTRDAVDETFRFGNVDITCIDTAGLRRRTKVRESVEFYSLIRAREAIGRAHLGLLMIDAREGVTNQDKKIASIIVEEGKGLIIGANKWDLHPQGKKQERDFANRLFFSFPHIRYAEVIPLSALTGYNKTRLLKSIVRVYNNYRREVRTSELNDFIGGLKLHRTRIAYGVQTGHSPPRFEFFLRGGDGRMDTFRRYVVNELRGAFEFQGVPIDVHLRYRNRS